MLSKFTGATAAAMLMMTMATAPAADARNYHSRSYYERHHSYEHSRRHVHQCRTGGTVAGALVGGVLGNAVTHHSTGGTLVGAAVGGVAGHNIAQDRCHRRRR